MNVVIQNARMAHKTAIESLYEDTCTIIERKPVRDETTKVSKPMEVVVYEDIPCKLSFESLKPAVMQSDVAERVILTKLFLNPDINVGTGSKIVVLHNDKEMAYRRSGEPGRFFTHQEIMLEPFERWA